MNMLDILLEARGVITEYAAWARAADARDATGEEVEAIDPMATQFSAVAAVEKAQMQDPLTMISDSARDALTLLDDVASFIEPNCNTITKLNNQQVRTEEHRRIIHAQVLEAFDIAILIGSYVE